MYNYDDLIIPNFIILIFSVTGFYLIKKYWM